MSLGGDVLLQAFLPLKAECKQLVFKAEFRELSFELKCYFQYLKTSALCDFLELDEQKCFSFLLIREQTWQISAQSCCFMEICWKSRQETFRNASFFSSTTFWSTAKGSPGERKQESVQTQYYFWMSRGVLERSLLELMFGFFPNIWMHLHEGWLCSSVVALTSADVFPLTVTAVSSLLQGFLERSQPKGPSPSTGRSMCSEVGSTRRWWRWKTWRMGQVCVCSVCVLSQNFFLWGFSDLICLCEAEQVRRRSAVAAVGGLWIRYLFTVLGGVSCLHVVSKRM